MHLVTTSIEDTWPKNATAPILFLGEWCRLFSRKSYWENLDSTVLPYHWDDRDKLKRDYDYLDDTYEKLIPIISAKLNDIHQVDYSTRYWRILIGPWLLYFIQIVYDRWVMLHAVREVSAVTVIEQEVGLQIPNDMADFERRLVTDEWNEFIYTQIILRENLVPIVNRVFSEPTKDKRLHASAVKTVIRKGIQLLNRLVTRKYDYFFISDYIPLQHLVKVNYSLGQIPAFWMPISTPQVSVDISRRKWEIGNEYTDEFMKLVNHLIPIQIPVVYLEGYSALRELVKKSPWPSKPSAIFTSNAYSGDDYFKAWTAEKTENSVPLVIGQHGGHFGMTPMESYAKHQYLIADKWLSWGWKKKDLDIIKSVGNLKIIDKSTIDYNPLGDAVLIEAEYPRYSYHLYAVPIASQYIKYLENQFFFLKLLPNSIFQKLSLKLYPTDFGWNAISRFKQEFPSLKIAEKNRPLQAILSKSRICIVTYNATTFLESFAWDVPTLIFWDPRYWELTTDSQHYFDRLAEVGIFHTSAESAAQHLINVWDNIPLWWNDVVTRNAVDYFCKTWNVTGKDVLNNLISHMKNLK